MKTETFPQLDDSDIDKANILINLGIPRIEARMIMYLVAVGPGTVKEIGIGSDLRQPEVSKASISLAKRGWIDSEAIKNHRRPAYRYVAKVNLAQIVDELRTQNAERQAEIAGLFDELVKA